MLAYVCGFRPTLFMHWLSSEIVYFRGGTFPPRASAEWMIRMLPPAPIQDYWDTGVCEAMVQCWLNGVSTSAVIAHQRANILPMCCVF